jgi:hypothetical protein
MCACFVICSSVPGNIYYIYPHHHTKFKIIILELISQTTNPFYNTMYGLIWLFEIKESHRKLTIYAIKIFVTSLRFNILPCEKEDKVKWCFHSASNLARKKLESLSFQNISDILEGVFPLNECLFCNVSVRSR